MNLAGSWVVDVVHPAPCATMTTIVGTLACLRPHAPFTCTYEMACAPSKDRHRATNALVRAFGEENGDGGGWAQLEVHALHSPFFAPTSKVERYPGHIGVASHGVMVGFTQFHHLVVVGGAEGVELLGTGRTPRSAEFGCVKCVKGDFRPQRGISALFFVKQNRADGIHVEKVGRHALEFGGPK